MASIAGGSRGRGREVVGLNPNMCMRQCTLLVLEEFLKSQVLLLRMVLAVVLPLKPRWLRLNAVKGPICTLNKSAVTEEELVICKLCLIAGSWVCLFSVYFWLVKDF
jgi:hypothetical protein